MRNRLGLFSFVLILLIALLMCISYAAEDGAISVSEVTAYPGQTVKVTVDISENPGITNMRVLISYDSEALTLTEVKDAGVLGEVILGDSLLVDEYCIVWFNPLETTDYNVKGTLATLSFEVNENAELKSYPVEIEVIEAYSADVTAVEFVETAGKITVEKAPDYILGDITGDSSVDIKDAVYLFRHSLMADRYPLDYLGNVDFEEDGSVDIKDAVYLFRHSLMPERYPIK